MRNYIILNGTNSNTISGLLIQQLAPISKPAMRTEVEEIDGRDGDIVTPLGFSAYDKDITIGLYGTFDINAIIAFFNSEGTVVFSNEPDKYYNYQITAQIDFERLVRYRTATVTFHCQPFKFATTGETQLLDGGEAITGEGTDIVLEGTAEAPFNKLDLKGNTTQTTLSGKNLFSTTPHRTGAGYYNASAGASFPAGTSTYVSTSALGDTISIACTATWVGAIYIAEVEEGKTYHYHGHQKGTGARSTIYTLDASYVIVRNLGNAANDDYVRDSNITVESGEKYIAIAIGCGNPATTITVEQPQLELGSTYSEWEQYCGGTASPNPEFPSNVNVVSGSQNITIEPANQKNIADPQTFIDWANNTNALCVKYSWGNATNRPAYGEYQGRSHVVRFEASTLYTVRNNMIDPNYSEAQIVYEGIFKPNIQYTISLDIYPTASTGVSNFRVRYTDGTGSNFDVGTQNTWSHIVKTTQLGKTVESIVVNYQSSFTYFDLDTLQIEEGTTASDYTPHIATRYNLNFGKNLLDMAQTEQGNIDLNGQNSANTSSWRTSYISVSPNTSYTFSLNDKTGVSNYILRLYQYDKNKTYTGLRFEATNGTLVINTGANTKYLRATVYDDGVVLDMVKATALKLMIEAGATATTYSSYKTPLEFCKIGTYQDKPIKKDDGKWYKHAEVGKMVLDGGDPPNQSWSKTDTDNDCSFWFRNYLTDAYVGKCQKYCNNFTYTSGDYVHEPSPVLCENNAITTTSFMFIFKVPSTLASTIAEWKTWLASHPTTVYYPLATPTDTKITDTDLIEQLEAITQAHAYRGCTHINVTATGTNAPHIIEAEVNGDASGTVTNAGNIYSKPKLTVYGSGDIGIYLNGVQMFQVALGSDGYITIDTNLMEAYKDNLQTLKNRQVTGDYSNFKLPVGANVISFSGLVSKCIVENFSRWL